ncbi:MAG: hypothetical protein ACFCUE_12560 [Candidatus Bathyarchaeia archaeon]|jgi:hypothetical protein
MVRGEGDILKATVDKAKKQLNIYAWFKCIIAAFALIIVAWIIQASNTLFNGSATAWVISVYYVGLTVIIGSIIWLIIYVSPNLIQTLTGPKNKTVTLVTVQEPPASNLPMPPKEVPVTTFKSAMPTQAQVVPASQEAPVVEEESESEKLRREFRNRRF